MKLNKKSADKGKCIFLNKFIMNEIIVECPKCKCSIIIEQLNCKIFRCGIYKNTYIQIPPHSNKDFIDNLLSQNKIYGCGEAFRIIMNNKNEYEAIKCSYLD